MDNPSPASGDAIPLGDGDFESLWEYDFGLQSFFSHDPDPTANVAAIPTTGFAVGAPTCASQAVRAPHLPSGVNVPSGHFCDADPRWHAPIAAQTSAAMPPFALSGIAREYAARSRRSSLSAQHPSNVTGNETCPPPAVDAAHWTTYNADLSPNIARPPSQTNANRVDFGPLSSVSSLSGPSFGQALAFSTAPLQWNTFTFSDPNYSPIPDRHHGLSPRGLDLTPDPVATSNDVGPAFCTAHRNSSSSPKAIPHPPRSTSSQGSHRSHHNPCSPTLSTGVPYPSLRVPASPSPRCHPLKRQSGSRTPSPSLAIVQYKPSANMEPKASRKRPALEEITPQEMTARTLREVSLQDEHGNVNGAMITFGNPTKKRAVFSEEKRRRTALARRDGVCPRCKKSKRQCDLAQQLSLYVPCTLCSGTKLYKNAPRLPCFKGALAEIIFFRAGPASNEPFFTKRKPVYELKDLSKPDVSVRTLRLTQHIGSHQLTVYASEYIPHSGDVVSYTWQEAGKTHERKMPPFCLTNLDKVHSQIRQYIASAKWQYLSSLESEDRLAWMTVSAAIEYARSRPDSLVADALDLWSISRIIEIPWEICGTDKLGITPVMESTNPHHQKILLPPIMDTQLDQIVIKLILHPLRRKVLEKFERLITPAKREAWWEIYLSAFILLNHIERLAEHSLLQARRHTMPGKYSNIPFLEDVFHTAKSILARFHFVCNGSAPLKLDWTSPKAAALAELEPDQVEFMRRTQVMIAERENDVRNLRGSHKYEKPLYWAGQLFFGDFDTSPVHVVEELEDGERQEEEGLALKGERK